MNTTTDIPWKNCNKCAFCFKATEGYYKCHLSNMAVSPMYGTCNKWKISEEANEKAEFEAMREFIRIMASASLDKKNGE